MRQTKQKSANGLLSDVSLGTSQFRIVPDTSNSLGYRMGRKGTKVIPILYPESSDFLVSGAKRQKTLGEDSSRLRCRLR